MRPRRRGRHAGPCQYDERDQDQGHQNGGYWASGFGLRNRRWHGRASCNRHKRLVQTVGESVYSEADFSNYRRSAARILSQPRPPIGSLLHREPTSRPVIPAVRQATPRACLKRSRRESAFPLRTRLWKTLSIGKRDSTELIWWQTKGKFLQTCPINTMLCDIIRIIE